MTGTYNVHSTVHPIVSIKGATLVTITSSRGLSFIMSLLVPGRDGRFGNSVCSVGLYPRGRDNRIILVPKFGASGNKTQGLSLVVVVIIGGSVLDLLYNTCRVACRLLTFHDARHDAICYPLFVMVS